MRLLKWSNGGAYELETFYDEPPPYAILSHTWHEPSEVTYGEILTGSGKDKIGYAKLDFCVRKATQDGLAYIWVDTCCINKNSETEISHAINSMFRWYRNAVKCYVYLNDVALSEDCLDLQLFHVGWKASFRASRWFTRGWTLQELLAPSVVEFHSQEERLLGTKTSLEKDLHEITGIPVNALRGVPLNMFRIQDRLSWAKTRQTTRLEDQIYCLLGIFGIFMPLIYGEGEEHARLRLMKELPQYQYDSTLATSQEALDEPATNGQSNEETFPIRTSNSLGLKRPLQNTKPLSIVLCPPVLAIPSENIERRLENLPIHHKRLVIKCVVMHCIAAAYAFYYNNELWKVRAGPSVNHSKLFETDGHDYVRRQEDLKLVEWIPRIQRAVLDKTLYGHPEAGESLLRDYDRSDEYCFDNALSILNIAASDGTINPLDLESSICHAISWCRSLHADISEYWLGKLWVSLQANKGTDGMMDVVLLMNSISPS